MENIIPKNNRRLFCTTSKVIGLGLISYTLYSYLTMNCEKEVKEANMEADKEKLEKIEKLEIGHELVENENENDTDLMTLLLYIFYR